MGYTESAKMTSKLTPVLFRQESPDTNTTCQESQLRICKAQSSYIGCGTHISITRQRRFGCGSSVPGKIPAHTSGTWAISPFRNQMHEAVDYSIALMELSHQLIQEPRVVPLIPFENGIRYQVSCLQEPGCLGVRERRCIGKVFNSAKLGSPRTPVFQQQFVQVALVPGGVQNHQAPIPFLGG